jgi:hypothetical protein
MNLGTATAYHFAAGLREHLTRHAGGKSCYNARRRKQ